MLIKRCLLVHFRTGCTWDRSQDMHGPSSSKTTIDQKWDQFGSSGYCKTFALAMHECEGHAELVIAAAQCLCYFQLPLGRGQASWSSTNTSRHTVIRTGNSSYCHFSLFISKDLNFQADVPDTAHRGGPVTFNLTHLLQGPPSFVPNQ